MSQALPSDGTWMRFDRIIYLTGTDDRAIRSAFPVLARRPMILVMAAVVAIMCSILIFEGLESPPAKRPPPATSPRFPERTRADADARTARRSTVAMPARAFRAYGPDSAAGMRRPRHESAAKAGRARMLVRQLERGMGWPTGGAPETPIARGKEGRRP
eukprot:CAMPEP_0172164562 /NCGR_PEP_ID=MMETSP1050-20130122/7912_1 /TAXON_ID=233186 /ORGANISM="Cryptomonas curvata, Strain CCAP979/52" /LENGTH=158 /DNA_ID=CAMNT_0012834909 /DNA_START=122 /DNA_END=598 /DNA_ORIENTATION=-